MGLDPSPSFNRRTIQPNTAAVESATHKKGCCCQIDGSQHDWLEGRGPYLTLIAAIDDATGTVAGAVFRDQEDTQGYFLMLRESYQPTEHLWLCRICQQLLEDSRERMEPARGFEPPARGLRNRCSTTELRWLSSVNWLRPVLFGVILGDRPAGSTPSNRAMASLACHRLYASSRPS